MQSRLVKVDLEQSENLPGLRYKIEGDRVPFLEIELSDAHTLFHEHHVVAYRQGVKMGLMSLKGGWSRFVAGLPILMQVTSGPGKVGFSRETPGHVLAIHLPPGRELDVREHQFLAATSNLKYDWQQVPGAMNVFLGGNWVFMDRFWAEKEEGVLWVHAHGDLMELTLDAGETVEVEQGAWVYKDPTVKMDTYRQNLGGWLSSCFVFWNRFTGPGKIGIQSSYFDPSPSA